MLIITYKFTSKQLLSDLFIIILNKYLCTYKNL